MWVTECHGVNVMCVCLLHLFYVVYSLIKRIWYMITLDLNITRILNFLFSTSLYAIWRLTVAYPRLYGSCLCLLLCFLICFNWKGKIKYYKKIKVKKTSSKDIIQHWNDQNAYSQTFRSPYYRPELLSLFSNLLWFLADTQHLLCWLAF